MIAKRGPRGEKASRGSMAMNKVRVRVNGCLGSYSGQGRRMAQMLWFWQLLGCKAGLTIGARKQASSNEKILSD